MKVNSNNNRLIILLMPHITINSSIINRKTLQISMAGLLHSLAINPLNLPRLLRNMKRLFTINFIFALWMCLVLWTKGRSNCFSHLQWGNLINSGSLIQCITSVWTRISWYFLEVRWIPCRMCSCGMDGWRSSIIKRGSVIHWISLRWLTGNMSSTWVKWKIMHPCSWKMIKILTEIAQMLIQITKVKVISKLETIPCKNISQKVWILLWIRLTKSRFLLSWVSMILKYNSSGWGSRKSILVQRWFSKSTRLDKNSLLRRVIRIIFKCSIGHWHTHKNHRASWRSFIHRRRIRTKRISMNYQRWGSR